MISDGTVSRTNFSGVHSGFKGMPFTIFLFSSKVKFRSVSKSGFNLSLIMMLRSKCLDK